MAAAHIRQPARPGRNASDDQIREVAPQTQKAAGPSEERPATPISSVEEYQEAIVQNQPEIKWIKHACATDSDVLIEVSTQRLVDALRASDPGTYVALGDPVNPTLEDRYERIDEAIAAGRKMESPMIGLDDSGRVGIADGRHRIAWCRDHDVLRITVLVNKDDAPGLLDLIG